MLDTDVMMRRAVWQTFFACIIFGVGSVAWAAFVPLQGAVAAGGTVVLENDVKTIQHPTGGVVAAINVVEGQHVEANDVLLKLDETTTRSNLAVIMNDLTAGLVRRARLLAERDGASKLEFPAEITERLQSEADVRNMVASELKLFESRSHGRAGQKAQLMERIAQTEKEIEGLDQQRQSVAAQLAVAHKEYDGLRNLSAKGLVPNSRMTNLDREVARNEGLLGDTIAKIAQSKGHITETLIQIEQIEREMITEVNKDLRETETKISELRERRVAAEDQLRRVDIRASIAGTVQQVTVHTVGGVIHPTDMLMVIVPDSDQLVVEARVRPQDRDQLAVDQQTRVRFTSFNQRTTPELHGSVFRISGDIIRDPRNPTQQYYSVGIRVPESEIARLNGAKLSAGMPAETFFRTGERTMLSYLLKPLTDHWHNAFAGR